MLIPPISADKVIRDPVHGYIALTKLEYNLIQLPALIRLHHVGQTSTAYLTYPGSVTSRFSHLIGALHMGYKIISQLLSTLDEDAYTELFPTTEPSYIIKCVRLACLFHDLGHGPFSHSGESIMKELIGKRKTEVSEAEKLFQKNYDDVPIHEYYSYKLITTGEIKEILQKEDSGLAEDISKLIIKSDSKSSFSNKQGLRVLRKVVSSQLDADRMDYLLRDTLMSGVPFGKVDVDRVILNMFLRKDKRKRSYELAIHERAIGVVEDMLDARFKMYKWLYNHHSVIATNSLIKLAMDQLMYDGILSAKFFHWSSFQQGVSTDGFVLSKLHEALIDHKNEYLAFKGTVDRRYIPVSIFKRPKDYYDFSGDIMKSSGFTVQESVVREKVKLFFKDENKQEELKKRLEDQPGKLKQTIVMGTDEPRKPYEPITPDGDQIWLFGETDDLYELTTISTYFEKINREWQEFPSVYISYVIPGLQKETAREYKTKIRELIISEIASV